MFKKLKEYVANKLLDFIEKHAPSENEYHEMEILSKSGNMIYVSGEEMTNYIEEHQTSFTPEQLIAAEDILWKIKTIADAGLDPIVIQDMEHGTTQVTSYENLKGMFIQ